MTPPRSSEMSPLGLYQQPFMPFFQHRNITPSGELGIWKIEEPESFFLQQLDLHEAEQAQLQRIKGRGQRLEWLASRHLVHLMSGRKKRGAFLKDEFGKPHLEDSAFEISISHSHGMAAVVAAPCSVGIDIQLIVAKIERIAHKYMREEEMSSLKTATRLEHLHVYWGAKEALYKAYGRKKLDFRGHIFVEPFELDWEKGKTTARVKKDLYNKVFDVFYDRIGEYVLVYVKEMKK